LDELELRVLLDAEPDRDLEELEPDRALDELEPERDLFEAEPDRDLLEVEPERDLLEPEPDRGLLELEDRDLLAELDRFEAEPGFEPDDEEPVRRVLPDPERLVERDRDDDPREPLWRARLPCCPWPSESSSSLRSFLPTPTAAAVASPTAAPVMTFFGVDMPSSLPFVSCSLMSLLSAEAVSWPR
jgi:hypothetical protein